MWATNQYYIIGQNDSLGSWNTWYDMEVGLDGNYEYFKVAKGNCVCKINTAKAWDGNEFGEYKNQPGFNNTSIGNCAGSTWTDDDHNACYWYDNDTHDDYYILVYYPNTTINTTDDPIICASSFLPSGKPSLYSVVGAEALCGSNWDVTDQSNDMAEAEAGVYSITYSDIDLAATTHIFKVAKRHNWACGAYPASNYELNVLRSGTYDLTITFTESTSAVTVDTTFKEAVVVLPTIQLGGEWASWTAGTAFTPAEGDETASTTIHFDEGQTGYSFKVVVDGNWLGHAKISESKPFTFDRGTTGARGWSGDDAAYIWIDKAGDYEFTWTYATDSLSVVYPTLANSAVTIDDDAEHLTISVKNGEEAIGATVQELTQLTITASADPGYRVKNLRAYLTAKTDSTFTISDNKLLMPGAALTITAEVGLVDGYYLVGNFNAVPAWGIADLTPSKKLVVNPDNAAEYMIENVTLIAEDSLKIANVVDDAIEWYAPDAANYVVDSNHAGSNKTVYYRPAGDGDATWWYNCIYVPDNSGGTALDNTADEAKAVKRIVNGQLVIEREGKLFNALGAEVK